MGSGQQTVILLAGKCCPRDLAVLLMSWVFPFRPPRRFNLMDLT